MKYAFARPPRTIKEPPLLSDAIYCGRHRAPAGRHRAPEPRHAPTGTGRSGRSRFAGSGYLLPTAAAATLALTATGAHLGTAHGASDGQSLASATPLSGATPLTTVTHDIIQRELGDRAARSDSRTSTSATSSSATASVAAATPAGGTDVFPAESGAPVSRAELAQTDSAAQAADDQAAADSAAAQQAQTDQAAKAQADSAAAVQAQATSAAVAATAHSWVPPINASYALSSGFGMRWGSLHPGQDFAIPVGTPVKAMSSGTVIFATWSGGYGNKLEIQYWDGTVSWYAHNSKLLVAQGDKVSVGETVSLSGSTGHSTGPHLHVEIHPNDGAAVPPLPWLSKMGNMP